jgi:hypothetical protein
MERPSAITHTRGRDFCERVDIIEKRKKSFETLPKDAARAREEFLSRSDALLLQSEMRAAAALRQINYLRCCQQHRNLFLCHL